MLYKWIRFAEIDEVLLFLLSVVHLVPQGYQIQGTKVAVVQNKANVSHSC